MSRTKPLTLVQLPPEILCKAAAYSDKTGRDSLSLCTKELRETLLCEVFRHIILPKNLDKVAPMPLDALYSVQSAKYRVTIGPKTYFYAKQHRNALTQQTSIGPFLTGLQHLALYVDFRADLETIEGAQYPPDAMQKIVARLFPTPPPTGLATARVQVDVDTYEVTSLKMIFAYLSPILKTLAFVPKLTLVLKADNFHTVVEAVELAEIRQAFLDAAANLRSLTLSSLNWITWLPSNAQMPNLESLAIDDGDYDLPTSITGTSAIERLMAFIHSAGAGGKLSSLSIRLLSIDDGPATSPLRLDKLEHLYLTGNAIRLLARSVALLPCKHVEYWSDYLSPILLVLRDLFAEQASLPGLETLLIKHGFSDNLPWAEVAEDYRHVRQAALQRDIDVSLQLDLHHEDTTPETILPCLQDVANEARVINLTVLDVGSDASTACPVPITLGKAKAITISTRGKLPADTSHLSAFEALMRHIKAPEVEDLTLRIQSCSAAGLRSVTHALQRGQWPRLRAISGYYAFVYLGETEGWSLPSDVTLREDFQKECKKREIVIEKLSFSSSCAALEGE